MDQVREVGVLALAVGAETGTGQSDGGGCIGGKGRGSGPSWGG